MSSAPTAPSIDLALPIIVGPAGPHFICVTGVVNLYRFILPPEPGSPVGQITTLTGAWIPLTQTRPAGSISGLPLANLDRQLATVCGNLRLVGSQVVLDVRHVSPGTAFRTPPGLRLRARCGC